MLKFKSKNNMKKILVVVFFVFFFIGNSYSYTKIDNYILEICADDRYVNKTMVKDFTTIFQIADQKYQELQKEYLSLKKKEKKVKETGQYITEYEKWEKNNPKPKPKSVSNYNIAYEQYKNDNDEWIQKSNAAKIDILSRLDDGTAERLRIIENQAFKDFDLLFKVQSIKGYLDHFMVCEREYRETPNSFQLKYPR
jgi:hypothetical protein